MSTMAAEPPACSNEAAMLTAREVLPVRLYGAIRAIVCMGSAILPGLSRMRLALPATRVLPHSHTATLPRCLWPPRVPRVKPGVPLAGPSPALILGHFCPDAVTGIRAEERAGDLRDEPLLSEPLVLLVPEASRMVRVKAPRPGVVGLALENIKRRRTGA